MTWQQFDKACYQLAEKLKPLRIDNIYGIPRGGLIVAVRLSHLLDKPLIYQFDKITENTLAVDDIVDEGKTLQHLKDICLGGKHGYGIANFKTATLVYHPQSKVIPDFWVYKKGDTWVKFPWEKK